MAKLQDDASWGWARKPSLEPGLGCDEEPRRPQITLHCIKCKYVTHVKEKENLLGSTMFAIHYFDFSFRTEYFVFLFLKLHRLLHKLQRDKSSANS